MIQVSCFIHFSMFFFLSIWVNISLSEKRLFPALNAKVHTQKFHFHFFLSRLCLHKLHLLIFPLYIFGLNSKREWYFVTKIVLWEKIVLVIKKFFEILGWRPRICKIFEITRTIYSNSERSEQFLVTECLFNLFLEVSQI